MNHYQHPSLLLLTIHPQNPQPREVAKAVQCLQSGGVIIIPTDSVYAFACNSEDHDAIEKVCRLIGKKPEKANLSLLCYDLKHLADYCTQVENQVFRLMKQCVPGPYTFILDANNRVPKVFRNRSKKTVGIRVPDNAIVHEVVKLLGVPLVSATVHNQNGEEGYTTNPEDLYETWGNRVDMLIDGGIGEEEVTSVLQCTGGKVEIIREGKGDLKELLRY